jgi:hypothetical protein
VIIRKREWHLVSQCGERATDLTIRCDGDDVFVTIDGLKIAKRENGGWTSLVRGYEVKDVDDEIHLSVHVMHKARRPR